jgi:hypothetical protein
LLERWRAYGLAQFDHLSDRRKAQDARQRPFATTGN